MEGYESMVCWPLSPLQCITNIINHRCISNGYGHLDILLCQPSWCTNVLSMSTSNIIALEMLRSYNRELNRLTQKRKRQEAMELPSSLDEISVWIAPSSLLHICFKVWKIKLVSTKIIWITTFSLRSIVATRRGSFDPFT